MHELPKLKWLRRRGLALALLAGYVIMALVAIEQGRTIAAQQALIHQLFQDSIELTAVRIHQHQINSPTPAP